MGRVLHIMLRLKCKNLTFALVHQVPFLKIFARAVVKSLAFFYLCGMISPNWKRSLRSRAGQHGMCEDKRHALEQMRSTTDAVSLYLGSIEWALGENYPSIDELRKNFSPRELEDYGIFIDREFNGERFYGKQKYVFHNCKGLIRSGLNKELRLIPFLYFANGCEIQVKSFEHYLSPVHIPLYIYGDCAIDGEVSQDIVCNTHKFPVK